MPKVDVYDTAGAKKGKMSLPEGLFAAKENPFLMAQAIKVFLARKRKAQAKAKTRGEVARSKAKIWAQKGTGRARHGSRSAPIFVGGGVAHGPRGNQNFRKRLPRASRRQALAGALTGKLKAKKILIIDGLEKIKPKTNEMFEILKNFNLDKKKIKKLLVLVTGEKNLFLASRNIPNLKVASASTLNTYQVLNAGKIIFIKKAIEELSENFFKAKTK